MKKEESGFLSKIGKDLVQYWPLYFMTLIVLGIVAYGLDALGIFKLF